MRTSQPKILKFRDENKMERIPVRKFRKFGGTLIFSWEKRQIEAD